MKIEIINKSSAQNGRLFRAIVSDGGKVVYTSNWYGKRVLALRAANHTIEQSEEARVPGLRSLFNF